MRSVPHPIQTINGNTTLTMWIWYFFTVLVCNSCVMGQEADEVKRFVLASITKIENYPSVVFKGRFKKGKFSSDVAFSVRGDQVWNEYNRIQIDDPDPAKTATNLIDIRKIMGSGELKTTNAFDGKNVYSFDPYNLTILIRPSTQPTGFGSEIYMLPKNWLILGENEKSLFRHVIEAKRTPVQTEKLPDGRWKFLQTGIGKDLAKEIQEQLLMRERFIIVDPKIDFLVVEYSYTSGDGGEYSGQLDWGQQDGNWYPKRVEHQYKKNSRLDIEWFIDEISFDAKKCRSSFDNIETVVPLGTKIDIFDANSKLLNTKYKGGEEGKQEYKLRYQALSKYRIEDR
jgi:hypothetical protein